MDASPEYIKLCEKAGEIQALWHSTELTPDSRFNDSRGLARHYENGFDGSFYWDNGLGCVDYEYESYYEPSDIWLPRQDQLQEMISAQWGNISLPLYTLITLFFRFAEQPHKGVGVLNTNWASFTSMEQLWLAFVMKEKFNKIWSGIEWVEYVSPK